MQNSRRALLLGTLATLAAGSALAQKPEQSLIEQHKALTATFNRGDLKKARTYYAPDYQAVGPDGRRHPLEEAMKGLESVLQAGNRFSVEAKLVQISIKGETATAIENAILTVKAANGASRTLPPQRSEQRWKKLKGVWKLAYEKSLTSLQPQRKPGQVAPPPGKSR